MRINGQALAGHTRHLCAFVSATATLLLLGVFTLPAAPAERANLIPKWGRFEQSFKSSTDYRNPVQEVEVRVVFTSPQGNSSIVDAFWDGENTWRVRFSPNELGTWVYSTACSDPNNSGLRNQTGSFVCTAPRNQTVFEKHGPVRLSFNRRYLMHDDATPFFWLADTAWNGALLSTPEEWASYIQERKRQKFTTVQWVATQFRAAPEGNRAHQLAFTGSNSIAVNPQFFRAMDAKVDALDQAGLLSAPVLLWAVGSGANPNVNPGYALPDDQAILLARYMVARWGANNVVWILGGDGDYRGEKAERWKHIGREVFKEPGHAPVTLHPGGMQWVGDLFANEEWYDIVGYQSGHGDSEETLRWIFEGPAATEWNRHPAHPFINLEPPYENHLAYESGKPHTPESVRRAVYWSLLSTPPAGVTYGGHGVWGWDDGTKPPTDHPSTGVPLPWREALHMPAASQMAQVMTLFSSIDFWRLRPAAEILAVQPGTMSPQRYIAAARSDRGDLIVVYDPEDRTVAMLAKSLPQGYSAKWFDPRSGQGTAASGTAQEERVEFATPAAGDWVLLIQSGKSS
jgi:hypothetical protein